MTNDRTSDRPGDFCSPAASLCCSSVRSQHLQSNQITNVTRKEASKWATSALWFHCPSPINNLSASCHLHSERGRGAVTIPARWIGEKMVHTNESLAPGNFRRALVHEAGPLLQFQATFDLPRGIYLEVWNIEILLMPLPVGRRGERQPRGDHNYHGRHGNREGPQRRRE